MTGKDGIKTTKLVTSKAVDHISSSQRIFPLQSVREQLSEAVLFSPAVPARPGERAALQPLLDAFLAGLGEKAATILSANLGRASARLIQLVVEQQRVFMPKPSFSEIVELVDFNPLRSTEREPSENRFGKFSTANAYAGWKRSMFVADWFSSSLERDFANIVDEADDVVFWVRLQRGELPILWSSAGSLYNPDFVVVEDVIKYLVETKADKDLPTPVVQAKSEAGQRWASHVSADSRTGTWRYLLLSETDVRQAKGSWTALRALGM